MNKATMKNLRGELKFLAPAPPPPTSTYFSFFGAVKIGEPKEGKPEQVVDLATASEGICAVAEVYGDSAFLTVSCPAGGWEEEGWVAWPIEATAPAAVAGACCNPHYPG